MSALSQQCDLLQVALQISGWRNPQRLRHAGADLSSMRRIVPVGRPLEARVSYLRAGPVDARRLILIHGTPGEASQWRDYLIEPPSNLEVVALDRPGFGQSGPAGAVVSLEAQAMAVAALLSPGERTNILLGHSLGGPVVAQVAAMYPDRVAAVVFVAAAVDPELESIHPLQRIGARAPVRRLLGRRLRNANAELLALKPSLERLAPRLGKVRAPAVIVHGTADDRVPFANVAYLQRMLSGARQVETLALEGADHFLPWNAAKTVRRAICRAVEVSC